MIKKIIKQIKEDNVSVIDIALYVDNKYSYEKLTEVAGPLNCYSISKNFTATAIGIAIDKNLLSADDNIVDIFKNELPKKMDERYYEVKVHHLLNQTIGIEKGFLFETDRYTYEEKNWVKLCLETPLKHKPGTQFTYSNSNHYLLSCIIHKLTGKRCDIFLRNELFSKLGIDNYAWEVCPRDETMGATGLYLFTSDMIKLGNLYLNKGMDIVSADWVEKATHYMEESPNPGYSYGFGILDHGFSCSGAFGQSIIVIPEQKIVFAAHGCNDYNYYEMIKKVFSL